jgi:hypothetical protein
MAAMLFEKGVRVSPKWVTQGARALTAARPGCAGSRYAIEPATSSLYEERTRLR